MNKTRKFTLAELITFAFYSVGYFLVVFLVATLAYGRLDYLIFMTILWPVSYELTRGFGIVKTTASVKKVS